MPTVDPGRIPGAVIIPSCVRVKLQWSMPNNVDAHNILHGTVGGGFAPTVAIANTILGSLVGSGAWTTLAGFLSDGVALSKVLLLDLRELALAEVESTGAPGLGTDTSAPLPPASCLVVTERTAFAGPAFRGRIYVPGMASDVMTSDATAVSGAITALGAWAATIPTVLSASGIELAIGHPARAGYTGSTGAVHPARAAGTIPVTELVVRNAKFDTQRKRAGRT